MTILTPVVSEWAEAWGIPHAAVLDLYQRLAPVPTVREGKPKSEAWVASKVRLQAAQRGYYLWRNNVGAGKLEHGSFLRWGLANESEAANDTMKSADFVGIKPRIIYQSDVGSVIGQFWSRETKRTDWVFNPHDLADQAQMNWAMLVNAAGGDARIVSSEDQS